MTITGAYGRKYEDMDTVRLDWQAGKDFRLVGGPYCSKRDFQGGLDHIDFYQTWPTELRGTVQAGLIT